MRLNDAGLEHLQISIDNAQPDEVSKKSLKVLDQKLKLLADHAIFQVNINSVLGSGVANSEDALAVANRALGLGFTSTVGIIHDGHGQLRPLGTREHELFEQIMSLGKRSFSRFNAFQHNIAEGKPNEWRCRSGSRYLYICEDGLVHWCSQQRGKPGVPLATYTKEDIRREYFTRKPCAPRCTVSCVQQIAVIDNWRGDANAQAARPHLLHPANWYKSSSGLLFGWTGVFPVCRSGMPPQHFSMGALMMLSSSAHMDYAIRCRSLRNSL